MKNYIHIINGMQIGGVEVGVLNLLKSSYNTDYKVLTVRGCDKKIYDSLSEEEKSRLYICNGYLNAFLLLIKLRPRLIVSSLWRSHFVSLIYKLISPKTKRVHFVHNAGFGHFINNKITDLSIAMADVIFADSSESKEWLEKEIGRKDSIVVPMNVSFSKFSKKFSSDPLSFVFVGRFCKQKNLQKSFDFIKELRNLGLDAKFDLYGRDDGELDNLTYYVHKIGLSDLVTFHNDILPTEIEDEMKKYNYYLQTSIAEGMAISVYQAIKNGLLAVINPVGEMQNYTNDGGNAFYLDLNNVMNSAKKFKEVIVNGDMENFNVGNIINKNNYPDFDESFFNQVNKLS